MPSVDQLIVWVIVGLLGGGLASRLTTRRRGSRGVFKSLAVGLAGALVGGLLFRILGLLPWLDRVAISLRDVTAAVVGSLIVLTFLWFWSKRSAAQSLR